MPALEAAVFGFATGAATVGAWAYHRLKISFADWERSQNFMTEEDELQALRLLSALLNMDDDHLGSYEPLYESIEVRSNLLTQKQLGVRPELLSARAREPTTQDESRDLNVAALVAIDAGLRPPAVRHRNRPGAPNRRGEPAYVVQEPAGEFGDDGPAEIRPVSPPLSVFGGDESEMLTAESSFVSMHGGDDVVPGRDLHDTDVGDLAPYEEEVGRRPDGSKITERRYPARGRTRGRLVSAVADHVRAKMYRCPEDTKSNRAVAERLVSDRLAELKVRMADRRALAPLIVTKVFIPTWADVVDANLQSSNAYHDRLQRGRPDKRHAPSNKGMLYLLGDGLYHFLTGEQTSVNQRDRHRASGK